MTLSMPGALPEKDDTYLCSAFRIHDWIEKEPVFITNFNVNATAKKVHHMIISGCKYPSKEPGEIW